MKVSLLAPKPQLLHNKEIGGNKEKQSSKLNFAQVLQDKLNEVNELQLEADNLTQQYLTGGPVELHNVMLAGEKATLALQLTVQVRNKIVDAYQEISRMQI
ncbi:flagellar hook-basal body complex protein FliE [Bacillota bacterium LX-D]|nr:flagellar hook-basal body complex protein FliE [Bacillota bacterium LX-D]